MIFFLFSLQVFLIANFVQKHRQYVRTNHRKILIIRITTQVQTTTIARTKNPKPIHEPDPSIRPKNPSTRNISKIAKQPIHPGPSLRGAGL